MVKCASKPSGLVLQEIEERKTFLAEMEELGKGKEYRARIMTEISQVCGGLSDCHQLILGHIPFIS